MQPNESMKLSNKLSPLVTAISIVLTTIVSTCAFATDTNDHSQTPFPERQPHYRPSMPTLSGYGNNTKSPSLGASGELYRRVSLPAYSDGIGAMIIGPDLRYISNRVFADVAQNLFSENSITQWAYNWAQFLDHSIGLKDTGTQVVEVPFNSSDPLEKFNNNSQNMFMTRTPAAKNTGANSSREQINTVSSFIDAWAVYGGTEARLEWLREGPVDGDLSNNGAHLLLTDSGYLPTADSRGDADSAPTMERVGRLAAIPNANQELVITGDIRANENIALTTVQTLFAREHNRIVDTLPNTLSDQEQFDIARQLVIATQQYITYNEFLVAVGIEILHKQNYDPNVDPSISHEFATVGFRAHSMIHGEIELEVDENEFDQPTLDYFHAQGIEIEVVDGHMEIAVPLNVAFANPQLANTLGIGAIAAGLGSESQYKNDEQIDNQLRSVLFQLPNSSITKPDSCLDGEALNECFTLAMDLGSLDIFRARDHGIANYNDLREAYGLPRIQSFSELTGESTESFVDDGVIDMSSPLDDPAILDYVELRNIDGERLELGSEEANATATNGIRRSSLAARLKAIYVDVDNVDAFVGTISEPHLLDTEFGELQYAMWQKQFQALRDGDANFYKWSPSLRYAMKIAERYGLTYQQTLSEVIVNNTTLETGDIQPYIFLAQH